MHVAKLLLKLELDWKKQESCEKRTWPKGELALGRAPLGRWVPWGPHWQAVLAVRSWAGPGQAWAGPGGLWGQPGGVWGVPGRVWGVGPWWAGACRARGLRHLLGHLRSAHTYIVNLQGFVIFYRPRRCCLILHHARTGFMI